MQYKIKTLFLLSAIVAVLLWGFLAVMAAIEPRSGFKTIHRRVNTFFRFCVNQIEKEAFNVTIYPLLNHFG